MLDRRILWDEVWELLCKAVRDDDRRQEAGAHAWIMADRWPQASPQLIAWRAIRRVASGRPIPGSGMGCGAGHYRAKERMLLQGNMAQYADWRIQSARLAQLRLAVAEVMQTTTDNGRALLQRMLDGETMAQAARNIPIPHSEARRIVHKIRKRYSKTSQ